MVVTSSITTIAESIANIQFDGISVKSINDIPESASLLCPLLIPNPSDFVSDYGVSFETYGSMGAAKINSNYSLNYIYLHCDVASGLGAFAPFLGIYQSLQVILETIFTNDVVTGLVDLQLGSIGKVGVITDPAGNEFWGVNFSLKVLEFNQ